MLRKALYAVVALAFIAAPIATEAIASIPQTIDVYKAVAPDIHPDAIFLQEVSVVTTDIKTGAKRCYSFTVAKKLDLVHSTPVPYPLRC